MHNKKDLQAVHSYYDNNKVWMWLISANALKNNGLNGFKKLYLTVKKNTDRVKIDKSLIKLILFCSKSD